MYCRNLTKKLNGNLRCKIIKQQITLDWCKKCRNFNPRENKGIKKKSTHRKVVSDTTYHLVLNRDVECRLKDNNCFGKLELHHIIYRSENVNLIDEPSNCIMLCTYHHRLVHSNKHKYQNILKEKIGGNTNETN